MIHSHFSKLPKDLIGKISVFFNQEDIDSFNAAKLIDCEIGRKKLFQLKISEESKVSFNFKIKVFSDNRLIEFVMLSIWKSINFHLNAK
jgi:hypothetical protein